MGMLGIGYDFTPYQKFAYSKKTGAYEFITIVLFRICVEAYSS